MLQKIISNDLQTKSIKSKQRKGWKKKNEIKKVTELIYFYFWYKKKSQKNKIRNLLIGLNNGEIEDKINELKRRAKRFI